MIYFLLSILLLLILTLAINSQLIKQIDEAALDWFNKLQSPSLDASFSSLTWLGSLWIIIPLSISVSIGLIMNGYHRLAIFFNTILLGTIATTYILKFVIDRQRPDLFNVIQAMPPDPSFPSAHSTQIFIFTMLLSALAFHLDYQHKVIFGSLMLIIASLVAISRMYLQVHFPSDIAAGLLVSLAGISLAFYGHNKGVLT